MRNLFRETRSRWGGHPPTHNAPSPIPASSRDLSRACCKAPRVWRPSRPAIYSDVTNSVVFFRKIPTFRFGGRFRQISAAGTPSLVDQWRHGDIICFLCFCQLALAPLLGPYPQAYTASQLRSLRRSPGRLDHRPVHIVHLRSPSAAPGGCSFVE